MFDNAQVTCHLGGSAPFPELLSMLCTAVDCRVLQAQALFPVHHRLAVMLRFTSALTHCTVSYFNAESWCSNLHASAKTPS